MGWIGNDAVTAVIGPKAAYAIWTSSVVSRILTEHLRFQLRGLFISYLCFYPDSHVDNDDDDDDDDAGEFGCCRCRSKAT